MDRNRRRRSQPFQSSHGEVHPLSLDVGRQSGIYLPVHSRQTTDLALLTGSIRLQSGYRRETTVHDYRRRNDHPPLQSGKSSQPVSKQPRQRAAARRPRLSIRPEQTHFPDCHRTGGTGHHRCPSAHHQSRRLYLPQRYETYL